MRQDWGMNGYGGDARFQQHGRDDERFMGRGNDRGRDMERGRGWARDDDQREHGYGMIGGGGYGMSGYGMSGYGMSGYGMRERDDWRARGDGWNRGWENEERDRGMRGDDELRMHRGEASIVKVIEVVAQSPHSWEDATRRAIAEASRTIDDIKSIYVKDMQAIVSQDRIVEFRLVAKISFAIHPNRSRSNRHERA